MSMSKAEWYEAKICEIEAKFAMLLLRVGEAEERVRVQERRLDNHEGVGDFCPHTGR